MPMGRPSKLPQGTFIAGWPVRLKGQVLATCSMDFAIFSIIGASAAGSGWACIGVVGISSRSQSSSARS